MSTEEVLALTGIRFQVEDPAHFWGVSIDLDRSEPVKHIYSSIGRILGRVLISRLT
jgi:hypothetical protein